jgi:hypothetical protein
MRRYSGSWLVLSLIGDTAVQCRDSGSLAVFRLMVRTPPHGRCAGSWPVRRLMVGAPAHGQCAGPSWDSGPWSVLRLIVSAPVHHRCRDRKHHGQAPSTTRASAQPGPGADGEQAPLVPRSTCSPPLRPSVRHQTENHKRRRQSELKAPCRCRHRKTEDRRLAQRSTLPDKRLQATVNTLRSGIVGR